jgi:hypothetical protein
MANKRKDRRIKEENRVVIEASALNGQGERFQANAFTRDLSISGARIWTDQLYPLNTKLKLILYLSRSRQVIRLCASVRWMKSCDDTLYEMGVQFQPGIPDSVMALINHIYSKDPGIPTLVATERTT